MRLYIFAAYFAAIGYVAAKRNLDTRLFDAAKTGTEDFIRWSQRVSMDEYSRQNITPAVEKP
jgi:hypothetical protein